MEILCYRSVRVPSTTAHSLYGVRSCALLSRHVPVQIIAAKGRSRLSFQELYGLDPRQYPQLAIQTPPVRHKGLSSLWRKKLARVWLRARMNHLPVVYVSQRKNAQFFARLRRRRKYRFFLLLECHDAQFGDGAELLNADALLFTSESLRQEIVKQYPFARSKPQKVFHHKIDLKLTDAAIESGGYGATKQVTYVGSVLPWKNLETLAEAIAKLPKCFRLKIVGGSETDAYRQRLIDYANQLGISDRAEFVPFVPIGRLPNALQRSDVLVVTLAATEQLRMPFKLLEYLSWRRPVIAPDLPCVRELVTHGKNAILYEADSASSLAQQIQSACNLSREQRSQLIASGCDVLTPFCAESWAHDFTAWLRSVAASAIGYAAMGQNR